MPISRKYKCIFVHIPKNAGTSIINEFSMGESGHFRWDQIASKYSQEWKTYFKFAVVRNPFDRFVSSYHYAQMEKSYWHSSDGSTPYGQHEDYNLLKGKSFEECCRMFSNSRSLFRNHSWHEQAPYICDSKGNVMVDFIVRYEHFEEDMKRVYSLCGKTPEPRKDNSSGHRKPWRSFYTPETAFLVYNTYFKDFKVFGYSPLEEEPLKSELFDISQITFFKNGQRLTNFYSKNKTFQGLVNFFEACDTTQDVLKSVREGLETKVYDPTINRFTEMIRSCPGKIGCNLSHFYLYQKLLKESPYDWHLILEDDVDFEGDPRVFLKELNKLILFLQENDFETHYIKLITFRDFEKEQFLPKYKIRGIQKLYLKLLDWGTGAQLISNQGLKILLDNRPWDFIDVTVNNLTSKLHSTCYKNSYFVHRGWETGFSFGAEEKCYGSLIYNMPTSKSISLQRIGFPAKPPSEAKALMGWFDENSLRDLLNNKLQEYSIKNLVELGTWYGKSALFFALETDVKKIYCVDLWDEDFIRKNPNIGFREYTLFKKHPLYETFLANTWDFREKIIPLKMGTLEALYALKYLPFTPDAFYIDAEHTYEAVSTELRIISSFEKPLIIGDDFSNDCPGVPRAVREFLLEHPEYSFELHGRTYLLLPPKIKVSYRNFWPGFNFEACFLKKFSKNIQCSQENPDLIFEGDFGLNSQETKTKVIHYSAESRFQLDPKYYLSISHLPTEKNNIQLRNYERIHFERTGNFDVYSLPLVQEEKTKFCCFVVSNPNCLQRNLFFKTLSTYKKVDSLGSFLKNVNVEIPRRENYKEYLKVLSKYKFAICFENTSKDHYLTEKLYNALAANTVPIYWGASQAREVFNPESFIYVSGEEDFPKTIEKIRELDSDNSKYNKILKLPKVLDVRKKNDQVKESLFKIRDSLV